MANPIWGRNREPSDLNNRATLHHLNGWGQMPGILRTLSILVVLGALAAPAAPAKTRVAIGLGDQSPAMFDAKAFQRLHIRKVRYFVRWDMMRVGYARRGADAFVAAARKAHVRVLMHVSTNDYRKRKGRLPSLRQYRRYVGNMIKRYRRRGVREFGVWNEANHYTQPTYKNPRRVAQYWRIARKRCGRTCTIVGLDVLDQPGVTSYVERFFRALRPRERRRISVVGIHNYGDVNRRRTSGTRSIIRAARRYNRRATFWFTETGGIVNLGSSFKCNPTRAANRLKYMFGLARRYRRDVKRLYAYNWFGTQPSCDGFDSGLVNYKGKPRKGYRVFRSRARHFTR